MQTLLAQRNDELEASRRQCAVLQVCQGTTLLGVQVHAHGIPATLLGGDWSDRPITPSCRVGGLTPTWPSHISGCVAFDANGFLPGFRCRRNFLCSQSAPPPPSGAPLCLTLNPAGPPKQSVIPGWNFILLLPTLWQRMCVRGGSVSHMAQS